MSEKYLSPSFLLSEAVSLVKRCVGAPVKENDILLSVLTDNYNRIELFDFGDLDTITQTEWKELCAYGCELIAARLFEFPYEFVAYHSRIGNLKSQSVAIATVAPGGMKAADKP